MRYGSDVAVLSRRSPLTRPPAQNVARTLSYIGPDGARLLPTSPLPVTYAYKPLLRASLELIAVYNDMRAWASGSVGATELADVLEAYARLPTRLPPHTAEVNWSGMGGGGAAYAKWLPLEAALSLFLDAQSSSPDTLESRHLEALLAAYAHHGHTRAHLRQAVELLAQATRQDAEDASVTNDAPETDVGGEEATVSEWTVEWECVLFVGAPNNVSSLPRARTIC